MFDKRKDTRKKLMAFTLVYTLKPKALIGYLEDLTIRGARVVGSVSLEADKLVTLEIDFPKDTASLPPTPFTIQARVARSAQDEAKYANLGFEFVDVTPEQTRILEAVIDRYEFKKVT
ncbi:MAG TPA: PilZ domain-containing protein [Anaerolineales bacterium]|nr:PilZ domain-containing protein [Anaerolineales bacterium]HNB36419.1 PilZ domain-containing protein [Anaerolineales bacterium]